MRNSWLFLSRHKRVFLAGLLGVVIYGVYQFYPAVSQLIAFGVMVVTGGGLSALFLIATYATPGLLWAATAIIYYLLGVKNGTLVSAVGFSVSYVTVSLLEASMGSGLLPRLVAGTILAYAIFIAAIACLSKARLNRAVAIVVSITLLGLSVYVTPLLSQPIVAKKATEKVTSQFQSKVASLDFTPYYPAYESSVLPVSPAELNGYGGTPYSHENVTFLLGKAHVKEGGTLGGQDTIMNFRDNCYIPAIWYTLDNNAAISQHDLERAQENPRKCNLLQTTPSGKKVYFATNGQWTHFYVLVGNTNVIVEFDDVNGREYDPNMQQEILKVLDSLKPLDTSKLQKGNSFGHGFSS